MLLLPITRASFPEISSPVDLIISKIPKGVQGISLASPITNFPTFIGWNPSTSLMELQHSELFLHLCVFGNGNCTKIP